MAELHDSMTPDEHEKNAIVPPDAVRRFVDAHARLMFEREHMTPTVEVQGRDAALSRRVPLERPIGRQEVEQ